MMTTLPSTSTIDRRYGLLRAAIFAACFLLTLEALASVVRWRANRAELAQILAQHGGADADAVVRRVAFEPDAQHARLAVARALVYEVLAPVDETAAVSEGAVAGLPRAGELALEVLHQQPNSWEASMLLGAATYLEWSLRADRRLYTAASEWEKPLLKARREAKGKPEPRRFLAAAYLETWAALSAEKKAFATELLREAFRVDPIAYRRLAPVWLEVADDREQALDLIPDRPEAWHLLERRYAATEDWEAFCLAHRRHLGALERKLERDLAEARERLRLGDLQGSRMKCLNVVAQSPRDGRFARLVTDALELYPPGLHGLRSTEPLRAWLSWALKLSTVSVEPFSPRVLGRLVDAVGDLDPAEGALAALIAEDTYRIQRYEKLVDSKRGREWAPFLVVKSRWLVERGELAEAADALSQVNRSWHSATAYWLARQRLARASGELADLGDAEKRLAELRSREWSPTDWRWQGNQATLEIYPEVVGSGPSRLAIEILKAPERGAVVEIDWDGSAVEIRPVAARQKIEVRLRMEPKSHLLELRPLAGGEVLPGRVWLTD